MLRFAASLSFIFLFAIGPLRADQDPVVIELFTSQGCSSCPPADALLHDLAERDDVIALALHVDYWDYIGWKDAFARPEHTKRQRAYAREAGRRMIYTPQIIVNGEDSIVGAKAMKIFDAVAAHRKKPALVDLTVERAGQAINMQVSPAGTADLAGDFSVILVQFAPIREIYVARGENAGRQMSYANVVVTWDVLKGWDGVTRAELRAEVMDDFEAAVLVQRNGPGRIVAAARVP